MVRRLQLFTKCFSSALVLTSPYKDTGATNPKPRIHLSECLSIGHKNIPWYGVNLCSGVSSCYGVSQGYVLLMLYGHGVNFVMVLACRHHNFAHVLIFRKVKRGWPLNLYFIFFSFKILSGKCDVDAVICVLVQVVTVWKLQ